MLTPKGGTTLDSIVNNTNYSHGSLNQILIICLISCSSLACHLRAALGTQLLVTRFPRLMLYPVTATGADTVTAWSSSLGPTHCTRTATTAATRTATTAGAPTTATSTSPSLEHFTHLLSLSTPTQVPFGAGWRVTPLLTPAAGKSRWSRCLPAGYKGDRKQLI